jgi:hypothetical protein
MREIKVSYIGRQKNYESMITERHLFRDLDIHQYLTNFPDSISFVEQDVLISFSKPIKSILINTKHTKLDGCDYLGGIPIEVMSAPNVSIDSQKYYYIYSLTPKNKYRDVCP